MHSSLGLSRSTLTTRINKAETAALVAKGALAVKWGQRGADKVGTLRVSRGYRVYSLSLKADRLEVGLEGFVVRKRYTVPYAVPEVARDPATRELDAHPCSCTLLLATVS